MRIFGKKLFGNNIDVNCEYCNNCQKINNIEVCKINKEISNGKCLSFSYNPLMRVPKTIPNLPKFSPKDFEL